MILHYKHFGDEDQPSVCIIHGLFGMLDNWQLIARSLSSSYSVFTMDMRNHGHSDHSDEMNYDLMANDVVETLRSLGVSICHFIGHSMGGKVVMQLAENYLSFVDKLVVVDIAPKKYRSGHDDIFEALCSIDLSTFSNRKDIESYISKPVPDEAVRLFLLKNVKRMKDGSYIWRSNLPAIYANYDSIIGRVAPLKPLSVHALFVKGEFSRYISPEDEVEILNLFPSAEFATIKGADHWVHADNPSQFLTVVTSFLERFHKT